MSVIVHVEAYSGYREDLQLPLSGKVYEEIKKFYNYDIVVIIFDTVCPTSQTFKNLYLTYGTNEFTIQVFTFEHLLQFIKQVDMLQLQLASQITSQSEFAQNENKKQPIFVKSEIFVQGSIISNKSEGQQKRASLIQQLINQHEAELSKLKTLMQSLINIPEQSQVIGEQTCFFCALQKQEKTVQTNCKHDYHLSCFDNLIKSQLALKQPYIDCLCGEKQQQSAVKLLDNYLASQIYLQQLIFIQVKAIIDNLKDRVRPCKNSNCYFVYIYDKKFHKTNYCPLCLKMEQIDQQ